MVIQKQSLQSLMCGAKDDARWTYGSGYYHTKSRTAAGELLRSWIGGKPGLTPVAIELTLPAIT